MFSIMTPEKDDWYFLNTSASSRALSTSSETDSPCKHFIKKTLRGQTVHFVNCKRIPQQGLPFCSFIFFDRSDKVLTDVFETCLTDEKMMFFLWGQGT